MAAAQSVIAFYRKRASEVTMPIGGIDAPSMSQGMLLWLVAFTPCRCKQSPLGASHRASSHTNSSAANARVGPVRSRLANRGRRWDKDNRTLWRFSAVRSPVAI